MSSIRRLPLACDHVRRMVTAVLSAVATGGADRIEISMPVDGSVDGRGRWQDGRPEASAGMET